MHAFEKIIPFVSQRFSRRGNAVLVGRDSIPLIDSGFRGLGLAEGRVCFVDAGQGEVVRGSNVSVQFVRLCGSLFDGRVRVWRKSEELFVVVCASHSSDLDVAVFDLSGNVVDSFAVDGNDPVLRSGGRRASPDVVASHVRELLEVGFAERLAGLLSSGDLLVRDGDLLDSAVVSSLRSLSDLGRGRGVVVLGLSKTCSLLTDAGNSAVVALHRMSPGGAWVYFVGGRVGFVRLHALSDYVFRFDVFAHDRLKLDVALARLAVHSSDPSLLGYPYGLIEVDKSARVSGDELLQLRARWDLLSRDAFRDVESALDIHDKLNLF